MVVQPAQRGVLPQRGLHQESLARVGGKQRLALCPPRVEAGRAHDRRVQPVRRVEQPGVAQLLHLLGDDGLPAPGHGDVVEAVDAPFLRPAAVDWWRAAGGDLRRAAGGDSWRAAVKRKRKQPLVPHHKHDRGAHEAPQQHPHLNAPFCCHALALGRAPLFEAGPPAAAIGRPWLSLSLFSLTIFCLRLSDIFSASSQCSLIERGPPRQGLAGLSTMRISNLFN